MIMAILERLGGFGRLLSGMRRKTLIRAAAGLMLICPAGATEANALAISANIQATHVPYGTVLDPIFAGPASTQIVRIYTLRRFRDLDRTLSCGGGVPVYQGHPIARRTGQR